MLKKLTVLFAFAFFVLVVSWAITLQAHTGDPCPHKEGHKHCNGGNGDGDGGDGGRPDFDLAILTIVDNPAFAVSSDEARTTGVSTIYEDSNVTPPDDPCVVAGVLPSGKGSFWIDFVGVGSDACLNATPTDPEFFRTYFLRFPEGSGACSELDLGPVNSFCELNTQCSNPDKCNGNATMRVEKLFSKTATTPVRYMFRIERAGIFDQYEVSTDDNVPIITVAADTRKLMYVGKARLFGPDGFVSGSFDLPFDLTVTRVPQ